MPAALRSGASGTFVMAEVTLAAAGLMWSEYWLFWIIGPAYGALVLLRGRKRWSVVSTPAGCTALAYAIVNMALPIVYGINPVASTAAATR